MVCISTNSSYNCVMEKNAQTAEAAPGAVDAKMAVSVEMVRDYLNKDLSVAISCLNAIQSDPDLMLHIAQFMHGRFQNSQQTKTFN